MKLKVVKARRSRIKTVDFAALGFGDYFSDHMLSMEYAKGAWTAPIIIPYGKFGVYPSLCSFHYGQIVFEGMKAFRAADGINLFRPRMYLERLNRSARRLCIPEVDAESVFEGIVALVKLDRKWIPRAGGH